MPELLPLFPLQLVVFPGERLPLHIFEERYKLLISRSISESKEFGIVLTREQGILNAGCSVKVESVLNTYEDGRMDVMTEGLRRFDVMELYTEQPYLEGTVEFFDDEDTDLVPASLRLEALGLYQSLKHDSEEHAGPLPPVGDPLLSFRLGEALSDLEFQSILLRDRSEGSRLRRLVAFLKQHIPEVKQGNRMKQLAPRNGFSASPMNL
jgi:Lon protease-like protein